MKTMNKWLVLCGVLMGVMGVGCGGLEEQQEEAATPGEVQATVCSYGYYTCPSDGTSFEYESLACEYATVSKPKAQSQCEAHCPVTCRDSGWMTY